MFDHSLLLAQAESAPPPPPAEPVAESGGSVFQRLDILNRPDELLDSLAQVPLILASVIVVVGVLCVFNGYRWHKWVVVVLAFLCGLGIGQMLSNHMGKSHIIAVSIGLLCAMIATPLLRVTVAIFGGLTGAFIGANTWTAIQSSSETHWAGAVIGFIVLAMASFLLFRLVVVLFTSVGGAAMVVLGTITLLMQVPAWEPAVRQSLVTHELLIPLIVTVAAVGGFILQNSRVTAESGGGEGGE